MIKTCELCKNDFETKRRNAYCSNICANKAKNHKRANRRKKLSRKYSEERKQEIKIIKEKSKKKYIKCREALSSGFF